MTQPDPTEAASTLRTAESFAARAQAAAETQRKNLARTTCGVGVLVGSYLIASLLFAPHHKIAFFGATLAYVVGLMLLMTLHRHHLTVAGRGWGRRYRTSLTVTMSLFVALIFGFSLRGIEAGLALSLLLGLIVAAPMVVTGARDLRR